MNDINFEVEAVPLENVIHTNDENHDPVKVKVKVRKKHEEGSSRRHHDVVAVPRFGQQTGSPERIRIVSSDLTVMSFDVYNEQNFDRKKPAKHRKIMKLLKIGGCVDTDTDDEHFPYSPSTTITKNNVQSLSGNVNDANNNVIKKPAANNQKGFMKKCKPGGCLDPPFGEDRYAYSPVSDRKALRREINLSDEYFTDEIKNGKDAYSLSENVITAPVNNMQKLSSNIVSIRSSLMSHVESNAVTDKNSSNYLITYPMTSLSKDEEAREAQQRYVPRRISTDTEARKSYDESANTYYYIPRTDGLHKQSQGGDSSDQSHATNYSNIIQSPEIADLDANRNKTEKNRTESTSSEGLPAIVKSLSLRSNSADKMHKISSKSPTDDKKVKGVGEALNVQLLSSEKKIKHKGLSYARQHYEFNLNQDSSDNEHHSPKKKMSSGSQIVDTSTIIENYLKDMPDRPEEYYDRITKATLQSNYSGEPSKLQLAAVITSSVLILSDKEQQQKVAEVKSKEFEEIHRNPKVVASSSTRSDYSTSNIPKKVTSIQKGVEINDQEMTYEHGNIIKDRERTSLPNTRNVEDLGQKTKPTALRMGTDIDDIFAQTDSTEDMVKINNARNKHYENNLDGQENGSGTKQFIRSQERPQQTFGATNIDINEKLRSPIRDDRVSTTVSSGGSASRTQSPDRKTNEVDQVFTPDGTPGEPSRDKRSPRSTAASQRGREYINGEGQLNEDVQAHKGSRDLSPDIIINEPDITVSPSSQRKYNPSDVTELTKMTKHEFSPNETTFSSPNGNSNYSTINSIKRADKQYVDNQSPKRKHEVNRYSESKTVNKVSSPDRNVDLSIDDTLSKPEQPSDSRSYYSPEESSKREYDTNRDIEPKMVNRELSPDTTGVSPVSGTRPKLERSPDSLSHNSTRESYKREQKTKGDIEPKMAGRVLNPDRNSMSSVNGTHSRSEGTTDSRFQYSTGGVPKRVQDSNGDIQSMTASRVPSPDRNYISSIKSSDLGTPDSRHQYTTKESAKRKQTINGNTSPEPLNRRLSPDRANASSPSDTHYKSETSSYSRSQASSNNLPKRGDSIHGHQSSKVTSRERSFEKTDFNFPGDIRRSHESRSRHPSKAGDSIFADLPPSKILGNRVSPDRNYYSGSRPSSPDSRSRYSIDETSKREDSMYRDISKSPRRISPDRKKISISNDISFSGSHAKENDKYAQEIVYSPGGRRYKYNKSTGSYSRVSDSLDREGKKMERESIKEYDENRLNEYGTTNIKNRLIPSRSSKQYDLPDTTKSSPRDNKSRDFYIQDSANILPKKGSSGYEVGQQYGQRNISPERKLNETDFLAYPENMKSSEFTSEIEKGNSSHKNIIYSGKSSPSHTNKAEYSVQGKNASDKYSNSDNLTTQPRKQTQFSQNLDNSKNIDNANEIEKIPKNATVLVDFMFRSNKDDNNRNVIRSLDTHLEESHGDVIKVKSLLQRPGDEVLIDVDPENDLFLSVKLKQNKGSTSKYSAIGPGLNTLNQPDTIAFQNMDLPIAEQGNAELDEVLKLVYEKELIPLKNVIWQLKEDIDVLVLEQNSFKEKVRLAKRSKRLVAVNKRCGCIKNIKSNK